MKFRRFSRNYPYAGTAEARQLGMRMRWGGDEPSPPTYVMNTPSAPTAQQTAEEYAKAMPIYYQTSLQYEPQIAAMQKSINEQLYPETAQIQERVAGQVNDALTGGVPEWYKANVEDTLKSQLGRNLIYNPQAQESYGIATQQAYQDWGNYWRNLSLAAAGRQPLAQAPNLMTSYTPQAGMNYAAQNYGTYAGAWGNMNNANANMYGSYTNAMGNYSNPWMNMAGTLAGGLAGGWAGGRFGK